jgi:hypothetical protein
MVGKLKELGEKPAPMPHLDHESHMSSPGIEPEVPH